ncbi:MAG: TIGR00701 family protein [Deltaproteobacteria bacterium]|nr:TIGR00701 family protein [Deltaproteobacteria bacterium]
MVYLFLLAIPIVGLLVIRAFYRDFSDLGDWLWFQDEYDAISQSIEHFGQSSYLYIQAIHIIGVVVWFAGLFYIGRLFVYHKEASRRPEPERKILEEQFTIMERRLWYAITWPGLCITMVFGTLMLLYIGLPPWIHTKLALVALLIVYHLYCGRLQKQLEKGNCRWNARLLRLFNEVPALLLVAIVFNVVLKDLLSWTVLLVILALLAVSIFVTVRWYTRHRKSAAL